MALPIEERSRHIVSDSANSPLREGRLPTNIASHGLRRDLFSVADPKEYYTPERLTRHDEFFRRVIDRFGLEKVDGDVVAVLHMFHDAYPFIAAIQQIANVHTIIPKRSSIENDVMGDLQKRGLPIKPLKRIGDVEGENEDIRSITASISGTRPTVFMDIGGWFADILPQLMQAAGENFRGLVEDTENGWKKWLAVLATGIELPIFSAARSPLKNDEDRIVGANIADATEAVLTGHEVDISGKKVGVIGYGKIGRSFAARMREKGGSVTVSEIDADRRRMARAAEFNSRKNNKTTMLRESDLICLANGDKSLAGDEFTQLKTGAWIVSVTSADDAIDKTWLEQNYKKEQVSDYVIRYSRGKHHFYLVADGDAVNLALKKPVGDRILLVHGELLVAAYRLLAGKAEQAELTNHEIDDETRDGIREIWNSIFEDEEQ